MPPPASLRGLSRLAVTVLVVDDNPDTLEATRMFLKTCGANVVALPSPFGVTREVMRSNPSVVVPDLCNWRACNAVFTCADVATPSSGDSGRTDLRVPRHAVSTCESDLKTAASEGDSFRLVPEIWPAS